MCKCELIFKGNTFNFEFRNLDEMRLFYFEARDEGCYEFEYGAENFILPFETCFIKYSNNQLKTEEM